MLLCYNRYIIFNYKSKDNTMNKKQGMVLCSLLLTSVIANAGVSGIVFKDLPLNGTSINTYGTKDSNEQGLAGITVTAYPSKATTTTDTDGSWSLESSGKVKIEFTNIPTHLKESAGQSSVQFIDGDASTVNLALYNPAEYTEGINDIAMTFQPSSALNAVPNPVALKILKSADIPTEVTNETAVTSDDIPFSKLGSVWGLAYDSSSETLYASALVRRHIAMGPEGSGAIYKINGSNVELFAKIPNVGNVPSNSARNLSTNPATPDHDPIFDEVGRTGLGDIDISADGTKLYTINLHTNQLIEIDIKTKAQVPHNIGNPFPNCPNDDVKSWGIGQNNGKVYVGSVCTTKVAEGAYISKFDGAKFKAFHHIPLNMKGENSIDGNTGKSLADNARWGPWITNPNDLFAATRRVSYPAPILSDIIFDENNGMILGFSDRTAMQSANKNYGTDTSNDTRYSYDAGGDIYRVCKVNDEYFNESNEVGTKCPQHDENATAPEFPEFFTDEQRSTSHRETALGGLAYQQGSNNILSSAYDPVTNGNFDKEVDTSGIIGLDTNTGKKTMSQIMIGSHSNNKIYNGKAGGIGDIELLTQPAPTEIGNRVWFDEYPNCIQDANESGIEGVKVSLYASNDCTGSPEGTTITDANGSYLFPVNANTTYSVCINGIAGQAVLNDKNLTCTTAGTSIHNNDATLVGADAKIEIAPLITGGNDHSFDFGFVKKEAVVLVPEQNNTVADHTDGSCDCHSYTEDSSPALNILSMMMLISLTSFVAFLFRKELNQTIK